MSRSLFAACLAALLAVPPSLRADPVDFSVSWSVGPGLLTVWGGGPINLSLDTAPDGLSFTVDHGTAAGTFTAGGWVGSGPLSDGVTPSAVVNLGAITFSPMPTGKAGEYLFSALMPLLAEITDTTTNTVGLAVLDLTLSGSVSPDSNTYWIEAAGPGGTLVDGHVFAVTLDLQAVAATGTTELYANVFVAPIPPPEDLESGPPPSIYAVPEPTSLLLGLAGLPLLRLRRRGGG